MGWLSSGAERAPCASGPGVAFACGVMHFNLIETDAMLGSKEKGVECRVSHMLQMLSILLLPTEEYQSPYRSCRLPLMLGMMA